MNNLTSAPPNQPRRQQTTAMANTTAAAMSPATERSVHDAQEEPGRGNHRGYAVGNQAYGPILHAGHSEQGEPDGDQEELGCIGR